MQFVMLIYETPSDFEGRDKPASHPYVAAWRAYHRTLLAAGAYVTGAPLKDTATATTVRSRGGRRHVQDGPFAEAKEQLGGFVILECPSLDAALEWAARCPAASTGAVEVRPVDSTYVDMVCNP
jgi:hypothetical protein